MAENKKAKMSKRNLEQRVTHLLYVTPSLVLYFLFSVAPILIGIYYSFTNWNGVSKRYSMVGLENYFKIFGDSRFQKSVVFNLKYAAMLVLCVVVFSVCIALLLNMNFKGRNFFRAVYFFPACLSMLTIGLIFNYIYFQGIPLLGKALGISALQNNILADTGKAIFGILAANVWQGVAIPTILILAALQTIPREIMEAAVVDGANAWHRFWHITVPYILPTISIVFVLSLKDGLMIYDYIVALTSGGPAGATESITLSIYRLGFEDLKFGYAISEAVIIALIIAVISILQIKMTSRKKIYD